MLCDERVVHLGEPSGLRVGDPLAEHLQGCRRAFEGPEAVTEVVVEQGDLASLPGLGRELDRRRGSPGGHRDLRARCGPSPGSRGRAPDGRGRAPRRDPAPDRRRGSHPRHVSPGGRRTAATSVSAPTRSEDGPSGSRSSSASTGSVHCRGSPSRRARWRACPSHAPRRACRPRPGTTRSPPPAPRMPRCSARPAGRPHRSGRAPRGVRGVLPGRGRAPARGSKAPQRCPGRALAPPRGTGTSAPVPRARRPARPVRRPARVPGQSRSDRRGRRRGPRHARGPWTRSIVAAAT